MPTHSLAVFVVDHPDVASAIRHLFNEKQIIYVEELDFLKFIFERGQEFEPGILRLLEQQHKVATIGRTAPWPP